MIFKSSVLFFVTEMAYLLYSSLMGEGNVLFVLRIDEKLINFPTLGSQRNWEVFQMHLAFAVFVVA